LRIALLWHMHQPDYRHPSTGIEQMPWVRLHALQNYYDMARLAEEAPASVAVTFNLTPVLISQLQQLEESGPRDRVHQLCRRPVAGLDAEERAFLVEQLFSTNEERKIQPVPGYARLHQRAGRHRGPPSSAAGRLSDQDLLDLQVFFHLAWSGRTLREDPFIAELVSRTGGGFNEAEREKLLDLQRAFLPRVLAIYRRLWGAGRIEISTTPLHHPILPLLCDLQTAREGNPRVTLGGLDFRYPQDAGEQLDRGLALAQRTLGRTPEGMWPSEGSLSEQVLGLLDRRGVRWVATDQQLLERSLAHAGLSIGWPAHLHPWRLAGTTGPAVFFRDTELSDRIGFTYARWTTQDAVRDLLDRARALLGSHPDPLQTCLPIILDGENAWEYYEDHGVPFLQALYRALGEDPRLSTVTFSTALGSVAARELPTLRAGSWISARLDTWIGHPEKNRAWELLASARTVLQAVTEAGSQPESSLEAAREHLLRAEASDWFWWLGDDHPTPHKGSFEQVFRGHVRAAWRALDFDPPPQLARSILDPATASHPRVLQPNTPISPQIDGTDRRYYDWVGAGSFDARSQSGAIDLARALPARLDFGFDPQRLYLRLYPLEPGSAARLRGAQLRILLRSRQGEILLTATPGGQISRNGGPLVGTWASARVFEAALDLDRLDVPPGAELAFALEAFLADGRVERLPLDGTVGTRRPGADFVKRHWTTG